MSRLAPPRRRPTARSERGPCVGRAAPAPLGRALGPFGVPVQPKLAIGPARDRFETEADRAADHVVGSAPGVPAITPLATAPAMRMAAPEEEAAQRAVRDESEEVQRQVEEEEEEELLQPRSDGAGAAHAASPSVEAGIRAARGAGQALPTETRSRMEHGFGRDFSDVRVHDDTRAARLSQGINARAFTTGSDIFFARGAYAPGTSTGDRLLAHELAHVAQQTGPGQLQPKRIQLLEDGEAGSPTVQEDDTKDRTWQDPRNPNRGIDLDGPNGMLYRLPELQVPSYGGKKKGVSQVGSVSGGFGEGRGAGHGNFLPASGVFHWTGKGSRSVTDDEGNQDNATQVQIWERYIRDNGDIAENVRSRFENTEPRIARGGEGGPRVYYLRNRRSEADSSTPIGTAEELARSPALLRPPFGRSGGTALMEVDHYIEIQLGGAHAIGNMWLLDRDANGASGREIKSRVVNDLNELADDAAGDEFWGSTNPAKPSYRSWPTNAHIDFARVTGYRAAGRYWDKDEIASGDHLQYMRPLSAREMAGAGFVFDPSERPEAITVFLSQNSAFRRVMSVQDNTLTYRGESRRDRFISGFDLQSATYQHPETLQEGQQIGTLTGRAFGTRTVEQADGSRSPALQVEGVLNVPIRSKLDAGFGGYIDRSYIDEQLRSIAAARLPGASPLTFNSAGLTDAWELMAEARVRSDNPLFRGFEFSLRAEGDAIILQADIPTDQLDFGPFSVTDASLHLGYSDDGIVYGGEAGFEIRNVGSGRLTASEQQLAGAFNFDIDAFNPAQLSVAYADGVWSGSATLGITPGTIPFVESGSIEAGLDEQGNFSIDGTANLAGPGIPDGTTLTVAYSQETGEFTFGGDVPLDSARLPGLTNARVGFTVTRSGAGDYRVAGTGSAAFALAGISGTVDLGYDNGIITANGEATVNRPPLTGSADFHLSNQAVGDDGQPIEGPPLETFRAWGGGTASIQFGRYITGTAGLQFLENGEIELMGQIALPPTITLIEAEEYHYDIFTFPEVRFPIIGFTIPVINRSFGVFGFIRGGLDANLTLGPGELVDSQVSVTYNPDQPQDMSITGGSTFQIGAAADVGLRVTGGIGAGLAIVEATGEVGLRGALGLELSGGASVTLDWTPTDGLSIDASVFGEAQPTFSISVVADARVVVDAVLWSGTLWNESWERELASIGPDMRWRAELPASWSERDGLDVDINNLELTYPDIDLRGLASDVFEAII